jgi:hypothetical protein
MDILLIWYAACLVGVLVSIRERKPQRPPRNHVKEWFSQLIASTDPMHDYLYDNEKSRPMELMDGRTAKKR